MFSITRDVSEGFDRLQELLLALNVGDELRVSEVTRASGLSEHVCRAVLEGLERAGLMTQPEPERFVRRRLELL